ncbi:hypothetical protein [Fredinandcohnia quinoae]|uniref:Uncharacterized protein n=1 Tax=Fredinandcohnia quinoae TaxID=2918902 RepID=A0AAW5E3Y5_9BACI|nr:hypothetical protein [Fredinandcohnia sp. SECRCQ15]MCH1624056.1 hypothetical protein [Fredinandcohnia sp. SECRCQ15]
MNQLRDEFDLSDEVKRIIINGIKLGLSRFYSEKEGKPEIQTARNFISRKRASYVFDSIYHLANQHLEQNIIAEIRSAGLSYEYVLLVIEDRNIMITFSQEKHHDDLPEYSEYRSEYTEGNGRFDPQLTLFEEIETNHKKYKHLIVTYNGSSGPDPEFVWIGATNKGQTAWIYHQDLMVGIQKNCPATFVSGIKLGN